MNGLSIAPAVMAGIMLFVGVYWLFIYFRRRVAREDLTFSLTCLMFGFYDVCCAGLYSAASVVEGMHWQRGQLFVVAIACITLTFFVADYTRQVSREFIIGVVSFFSVASIMNLINLGDMTWNLSDPLIRRIEIPFGLEFTYREARPGPLLEIQFAASSLIFVYLFWAVYQQYRHGERRRAKMLFAAMTVFFLSATNDVLVGLGVYNFIYLVEYGYLAMVLLMSSSLSSELVEAAIIKEERKELEEQLRQAQKLEAIGRLAGGIAHDLNNQLTPIIGYADIALNRKKSVEEMITYMGQIRQSAEHAKDMAAQLLAFSRKQVLDMNVLNINRVISESKKMLRRLIRENIEIKFDLHDDVGNIQADVTQMRQVFMNLVINAQDAMPGGGIMSISTESARIDRAYKVMSQDLQPGSYVMLSVSDTGCGMDTEIMKHIFEPFYTTKESGKGSGLGLATVWGIVKQHNGSIIVYSEPGQGTTFKVYFPRSYAPTSLISEIPKYAAKEVGGKETILVVEDEEGVRNMVREVLEDIGYTTLEAEAPKEALALSDEYEGEINVLLTDVIMPGMNGKNLFESISKKRPGIRVLFMSGYAGDASTHRSILEGGYSLISKPFSIQKLTTTLRTVLDQD